MRNKIIGIVCVLLSVFCCACAGNNDLLNSTKEYQVFYQHLLTEEETPGVLQTYSIADINEYITLWKEKEGDLTIRRFSGEWKDRVAFDFSSAECMKYMHHIWRMETEIMP